MAFAKLLQVLNHVAPFRLIRCIDGMDGEILVKRGGASSSGSSTSRYLNAGMYIRCKYRHLHLATHRLVNVTTPLSTAAQHHPPNYDFNSHTCTDNFNESVPMSQPTLYVYEEKLSNYSQCFYVDGLREDFSRI